VADAQRRLAGVDVLQLEAGEELHSHAAHSL